MSATYGNIQRIVNLTDATQTLVANLAPFLISGKSIERACAVWSGFLPVLVLSAGTMTDQVTYAPGETCAYIHPVGGAAPNEPVVSMRLADESNASGVAIQWTTTPYVFQAGDKYPALYETYQLTCSGTPSICSGTLPADRNLLLVNGVPTVYGRIVYYGPSNQTLAIGSQQTF